MQLIKPERHPALVLRSFLDPASFHYVCQCCTCCACMPTRLLGAPQVASIPSYSYDVMVTVTGVLPGGYACLNWQLVAAVPGNRDADFLDTKWPSWRFGCAVFCLLQSPVGSPPDVWQQLPSALWSVAFERQQRQIVKLQASQAQVGQLQAQVAALQASQAQVGQLQAQVAALQAGQAQFGQLQAQVGQLQAALLGRRR